VHGATAPASEFTARRELHIGVEGFWPYACVTPTRAENDANKLYRLTLRDIVVMLITVAGMWGMQVATQGHMQASIDVLGGKLDGYVIRQAEANIEFQRQLDEVRKQAALGVVLGNEAKTEAARLGGILVGAGVKGVK